MLKLCQHNWPGPSPSTFQSILNSFPAQLLLHDTVEPLYNGHFGAFFYCVLNSEGLLKEVLLYSFLDFFVACKNITGTYY